jgi:hypothetical protein
MVFKQVHRDCAIPEEDVKIGDLVEKSKTCQVCYFCFCRVHLLQPAHSGMSGTFSLDSSYWLQVSLEWTRGEYLHTSESWETDDWLQIRELPVPLVIELLLSLTLLRGIGRVRLAKVSRGQNLGLVTATFSIFVTCNSTSINHTKSKSGPLESASKYIVALFKLVHDSSTSWTPSHTGTSSPPLTPSKVSYGITPEKKLTKQ